jgi:hypothetical protein
MRAFLIIALVSLAACSTRNEDGDDPGGFSVSDQIGDWSATIDSRNKSGLRGTASVHSAVAGSMIRIAISGAAANNHHPWHVHRGTCDTGGPIVGDANAYPALHIGSDGTASGSITIGTALNDDVTYHVNVHRSAAQMDVIIACGNLKN